MEVGPIFSPTANTAELLLLLFFAMTFAPGLPIMMPLACVAFTLFFFTDKMLFLHYYQRPAHLNDGVMQVVLRLLPWAAVIRLAIGCWMLGQCDSSKYASPSNCITL